MVELATTEEQADHLDASDRRDVESDVKSGVAFRANRGAAAKKNTKQGRLRQNDSNGTTLLLVLGASLIAFGFGFYVLVDQEQLPDLSFLRFWRAPEKSSAARIWPTLDTSKSNQATTAAVRLPSADEMGGLKALGFTVAELREECYSDAELRAGGFSAKELIAPPPSPMPPPPPPPPPPLVKPTQMVAEINARYAAGQPSSHAEEAGVLIHQARVRGYGRCVCVCNDPCDH